MKIRFGLVCALSVGLSSSISAAEDPALTRVSTGILAGGSFYSVYEVQCPDDSLTAIVSLNRRTKWCAQEGSGVACLRDHREASLRACLARQGYIAQMDVGELAGKALK